MRNGVGLSGTVKPWFARLFYTVLRWSDDTLAQPRSTGKAALYRNAGMPSMGGWIEDT